MNKIRFKKIELSIFLILIMTVTLFGIRHYLFFESVKYEVVFDSDSSLSLFPDYMTGLYEYEQNGNVFYTTHYDPQMYFILPHDESLSSVLIELASPVSQNSVIQIYYANQIIGGYSEQNSVSGLLMEGKSEIFLELPADTYDEIRFDINIIDEYFEIVNIRVVETPLIHLEVEYKPNEPIVIFFTLLLNAFLIILWLIIRNRNCLDKLITHCSELFANIKNNRLSWKTVNIITSHWSSGVIVLLIFLIIGSAIYKDYSVSTDEPAQLRHSHVAYKYIFRDLLKLSNSENVKEFIANTLRFETYSARYYGTVLQIPLVAIEHIMDFSLSTREVFQLRHAYNYFNYLLSALCFYLIFRKRFNDRPIALIGLLMYLLYPRLFGEAFFNIKDPLFASWYIIAAFFGIHYLEKSTTERMFLFVGAAAICTNTRIIGFSILMLVLAYLVLISLFEKRPLKSTCITCASLLFAFFVFSTFINPLFWGNPLTSPIKGFIETINRFGYYEPWTGTHFFLGELITKDVPWYYIPVWIGVTTPVLYVLLFLLGCCLVFKNLIGAISNKKEREISLLYDSFFAALLFASYFGLVITNAAMYIGWRHSYFLFCPFLYITVCGLNRMENTISNMQLTVRHRIITFALYYCGIVIYLSAIGAWNIRNHPYQNVYFNALARPYAEENFELDAWRMSALESLLHMLQIDDSEILTLRFAPYDYDFNSRATLDEGDASRIRRTSLNYAPEYIITTSRGSIHDRRSFNGYQRMFSVSIDSFDISALFKYTIQSEDFSSDAHNNIHAVTFSRIADEASHSLIEFEELDVYDYFLYVPNISVVGDILQVTIEFNEPVDYNLVRVSDSISDVHIAISLDGVLWESAEVVFSNFIDSVLMPKEYRFIRLDYDSNRDEDNPWDIGNMHFGSISTQVFSD